MNEQYFFVRIDGVLVAFYDIRPGNGAGLFWQPRSPHGAELWSNWAILYKHV